MSWWSNMKIFIVELFFRDPGADEAQRKAIAADAALAEFHEAQRWLRDQTAELFRTTRRAKREKDVLAELVEGIRRGME